MKVTDPTLPPRSEGARSLEGCNLFDLARHNALARAIAKALFERPEPAQADETVPAGSESNHQAGGSA